MISYSAALSFRLVYHLNTEWSMPGNGVLFREGIIEEKDNLFVKDTLVNAHILNNLLLFGFHCMCQWVYDWTNDTDQLQRLW